MRFQEGAALLTSTLATSPIVLPPEPKHRYRVPLSLLDPGLQKHHLLGKSTNNEKSQRVTIERGFPSHTNHQPAPETRA
jgi:hypothetical protein